MVKTTNQIWFMVKNTNYIFCHTFPATHHNIVCLLFPLKPTPNVGKHMNKSKKTHGMLQFQSPCFIGILRVAGAGFRNHTLQNSPTMWGQRQRNIAKLDRLDSEFHPMTQGIFGNDPLATYQYSSQQPPFPSIPYVQHQ